MFILLLTDYVLHQKLIFCWAERTKGKMFSIKNTFLLKDQNTSVIKPAVSAPSAH